MRKTSIFITTQFEGYHRWKDAPNYCKFLREPHRHIFHVQLTISVSHDDREIEFITCKNWLNQVIEVMTSDHMKVLNFSCEMYADAIISAVEAEYGSDRQIECVVSEDGENGAIVKNF